MNLYVWWMMTTSPGAPRLSGRQYHAVLVNGGLELLAAVDHVDGRPELLAAADHVDGRLGLLANFAQRRRRLASKIVDDIVVV